MNIGSLITTLGVDSRSLDKAEIRYRNFTSTIDSRTNKIGRSLSVLEKKIAGVSAIAISLGAALGLFKGKDYIKDVALMAGRYDTLGISMAVAGENAGYTIDQMQGLQSSLQEQGIAAIESRQALTRLAVANIDLAKATNLGRAAQDLAVVSGENSSKTFERLVYAIQSGSVVMLRRIGLNVSFQDSYKRVADETKRTVQQLSAEEKTQIRANAVIKAATRYLGIYEKSMGSAFKQMGSLQRHIDNYKVAFGKAFQPAFLEIVKAKTILYKKLSDVVSSEAFQNAFKELSIRFAEIYKSVTRLIPKIVELTKTINTMIGVLWTVTKVVSVYVILFKAIPFIIARTAVAKLALLAVIRKLIAGFATLRWTINDFSQGLAGGVFISNTATSRFGFLNKSLFGVGLSAQFGAKGLALFGKTLRAVVSLKGLFAAFIGYEIGKYLQDNYAWVRRLGVAIVDWTYMLWSKLEKWLKDLLVYIRYWRSEAVKYLTDPQKIAVELTTEKTTGIMAKFFKKHFRESRLAKFFEQENERVAEALGMRSSIVKKGLADNEKEYRESVERHRKLIDQMWIDAGKSLILPKDFNPFKGFDDTLKEGFGKDSALSSLKEELDKIDVEKRIVKLKQLYTELAYISNQHLSIEERKEKAIRNVAILDDVITRAQAAGVEIGSKEYNTILAQVTSLEAITYEYEKQSKLRENMADLSIQFEREEDIAKATQKYTEIGYSINKNVDFTKRQEEVQRSVNIQIRAMQIAYENNIKLNSQYYYQLLDQLEAIENINVQIKKQEKLRQDIADIKDLILTDEQRIRKDYVKRIEYVRQATGTIIETEAEAMQIIEKLNKKMNEEIVNATKDRFNFAATFSRQMAENMQRNFSDLFYNIAKGTDSFKDFFKNFADSLLRIWSDMMAQMVAEWLFGQEKMSGKTNKVGGVLGSLVDIASGGITGGISGLFNIGNLGGLKGQIAGPTMNFGGVEDLLNFAALNSKGNIFPDVSRFEKGGITKGTTIFDMGMMGEKGPEAIMPLKRNSQGQLGVMAVNNNVDKYNKTIIPNIFNKISTIESLLDFNKLNKMISNIQFDSSQFKSMINVPEISGGSTRSSYVDLQNQSDIRDKEKLPDFNVTVNALDSKSVVELMTRTPHAVTKPFMNQWAKGGALRNMVRGSI